MLDILTFELSGRLALEMTELILGSLEAECVNHSVKPGYLCRYTQLRQNTEGEQF